MKTITITMDEKHNVNIDTDGFVNEFEVNGLLQTVLLHRCVNTFTGEKSLPTGHQSTESPSAAGAEEG